VVSLKVIILTWEFPPRVVGEQAVYVETLSRSLVARDVDVHVITFQDGGDGSIQEFDGIKVSRISNPIETHVNILTWDLALMTEFERISSDILYSAEGVIDLIDAHEWTCISAAILLKRAFNLPFLYTIHSLEEHRSNFAKEPLNVAISNLEHLGVVEADRLLVTSHWMRSQIRRVHGDFSTKLDVISAESPMWVEEVLTTYDKTRQA
jgi:glycosyltransferase involved in cell wall biosynthesis